MNDSPFGFKRFVILMRRNLPQRADIRNAAPE
jgi:hypothetical protein